MKLVLRACAWLLLLACAPAFARLTSITVTAVEPFAPGTGFGNTGPYERVKGVFRGELDPQDARNRVIVNIDKAPRNASGKVEYEADFFMLRPADPARANGRIIYDVTNRGRLYIHWRLMDARLATPHQRRSQPQHSRCAHARGRTAKAARQAAERPRQAAAQRVHVAGRDQRSAGAAQRVE